MVETKHEIIKKTGNATSIVASFNTLIQADNEWCKNRYFEKEEHYMYFRVYDEQGMIVFEKVLEQYNP